MAGAAHHQKWQILELYAGLHLGVAVVLQAVLPVVFFPGVLWPIWVGLGGLLVLASLVLIHRARKELGKNSQPTDPGFETTKLVTSGPFSFSRNPLSVATLGVLLGLGFLLANPWCIGLIALTAPCLRAFLIAPEERYLARAFGSTYADYCQTVPRWLF